MSRLTPAPSNGVPTPGTDDASTGKSRRETSTLYWFVVLLVLALLSEETAYAYNLVTPALPDMAAAFHTNQIAWVTTLFTLVGGVTAPVIGKIADIHGKKRVLLATTGVMALGSLVVALAPSFPVVLVGRALEGTAIAILPLSYSLMRDILPKRLLAIGISIATAGIGLTGILGPIVAGALIDHFTYRGVFGFLTVFPLVLGTLVWILVPESSQRGQGRLDWWGAGLLGASIALVMFGLSQGPAWGWTAPSVLGCLTSGVLLLVCWGFYERRPQDPLIDLRLLRSRAVLTTAVTQFTAQGLIALNFVLLAFLVQVPRSLGHSYGFGASAEGLASYTTPIGVISMLMGFGVGFSARRRGARLPLWISFIFAAAGSAMLGTWHDQPWHVLLGSFVYAVGGGLMGAAIPNQVVDAVPAEHQAVMAGTVNLLGALGSSIFVQLGFVILNSHVGTVVQGQPIYTGQGFVLAYYFTALLGVIGFAAALAMRHGTPNSSTLIQPRRAKT